MNPVGAARRGRRAQAAQVAKAEKAAALEAEAAAGAGAALNAAEHGSKDWDGKLAAKTVVADPGPGDPVASAVAREEKAFHKRHMYRFCAARTGPSEREAVAGPRSHISRR